MSQLIQGIIHGKTIQLEKDPGVPDGQKVEISIRVVRPENKPWGEGLHRAAGSLANLPGLDEDMTQILEERKSARFREVPE